MKSGSVQTERGEQTMPDREKVIKGLQAHADGCGYRSHHCDAMNCPYRYGDESCDIKEMCHDAIAMIDTQYKLIRELQNLISIGTKMMNGGEA